MTNGNWQNNQLKIRRDEKKVVAKPAVAEYQGGGRNRQPGVTGEREINFCKLLGSDAIEKEGENHNHWCLGRGGKTGKTGKEEKRVKIEKGRNLLWPSFYETGETTSITCHSQKKRGVG